MITHLESQQISWGVFNKKGGSATGIDCGLGAFVGFGCGIHLEMLEMLEMRATTGPDARKAGFDSCVYIPFASQVATLLAAFARQLLHALLLCPLGCYLLHPCSRHLGHIVLLRSLAFAHLPPRSNLKSFGYNADPEPGLDTNTASVSGHRAPEDVNAFWFSCAPPSYQEVFKPP